MGHRILGPGVPWQPVERIAASNVERTAESRGLTRAAKAVAASFMRHRDAFGPLFPPRVLQGGMVPIDLSDANPDFTAEVYSSSERFHGFIRSHLDRHRAALAWGGYRERRGMYAKSTVFDARADGSGERRIHMGLDFWGAEGTPVLAPLDGVLHSSGMHPDDGDYGATLVLSHELDGAVFHTLYGHLCEADLSIPMGSFVRKSEVFARFGGASENGNWPPHLHYQVVVDMGGWKGDYPGVCSASELAFFSVNCPDPSNACSN